MSLELILQEQTNACEEARRLILDENSLLKATGQPPDDTFLEKKKGLLHRLDSALRALSAYAAKRSEIKMHSAAIGKAQQLILRTLLLDRENEQLLLKCTMNRQPAATRQFMPSASHLQKIYKRHAASAA